MSVDDIGPAAGLPNHFKITEEEKGENKEDGCEGFLQPVGQPHNHDQPAQQDKGRDPEKSPGIAGDFRGAAEDKGLGLGWDHLEVPPGCRNKEDKRRSNPENAVPDHGLAQVCFLDMNVLKKSDGRKEGLKNPSQKLLVSSQFPGVSIKEMMPSMMKREIHAAIK
jgi:hypothetical protein